MQYHHPYDHSSFKRVLYNNTVRVQAYPQSCWVRGTYYEDDNNAASWNNGCRSRLKQMLNYFKRSSVERPLSTTVPKPRDLCWMINSIHLPKQYHGISEPQSKAPWTVLLRFMFVDIRRELKDRSPGGVHNWRSFQTEPLVDRKVPFCYGKPGRRFVFSQQGVEHGNRVLRGDWLVTAYVWGESREWLDSVEVGKLVSWGNALSIRGYRPDSDEEDNTTHDETLLDPGKTSKPDTEGGEEAAESQGSQPQGSQSHDTNRFYRIFYDFERQEKGPPCRFLFARPPGYVGSTPLAVMFGTPISVVLQELCGLMDTNLKILLRDEHETHESKSSGDTEENSDSPHLYGTNTREQLAALGQP